MPTSYLQLSRATPPRKTHIIDYYLPRYYFRPHATSKLHRSKPRAPVTGRREKVLYLTTPCRVEMPYLEKVKKFLQCEKMIS